MKLLITGSREADERMMDYIDKAIKRAKELDWSIIVGDAFGVDKMVADACEEYDVSFFVYGLDASPRNSAREVPYVRHYGDYYSRDRHMVVLCDKCLAIWDGYSKETKYTYNYAVAQKKEAWLRIFRPVKERIKT